MVLFQSSRLYLTEPAHAVTCAHKHSQGKQKRNNRKGKDKGRDDRTSSAVQDEIEQDSPTSEIKDLPTEHVSEKPEAVEDVSDMSDSVECVPEILPPYSEDRDLSPVHWDTDNSEVQPPVEASSGTSGLSGVQNGVERRSPSVVDDSSSTCSTESIPSVVLSVPPKENPRCHKNQKSQSR